MFKKGDKVRLKSGGPAMSVQDVHAPELGGAVSCSWFSGDDLKHGSFTPESLEYVREDRPSRVDVEYDPLD